MEQGNIIEKKFVAFTINNNLYGIDVDQVNSIEKLSPITRIPNTKEFVKGVINLRGTIIPIIDLNLRLGLKELQYNENTRIIVVNHNNEKIGLVVESTNDIVSAITDQIKEFPETVENNINEQFSNGIIKLDKYVLILLDLSVILNNENILQKDIKTEQVKVKKEKKKN